MRRLTITTAISISLLLLLGAGAASAETLSAWWHLTSGARPGVLPAAGEEAGKIIPGQGEVYDTIANVGDGTASFEGSTDPVRILDTLPPGLKATQVDGTTPVENSVGNIPCKIEPEVHGISSVSCEFVGGTGVFYEYEKKHRYNGLLPYHYIEVRIRVEVEPGASAAVQQNELSVSGGESSVCKNEGEEAHECSRVSTGPIPSASVKQALRVGSGPTPFGVEANELSIASVGGGLDTQAGSHPFEATFTTVMNQGPDEEKLDGGFLPEYKPYVEGAGGMTKDLRFKLPPGLVGNPQATPQCPLGEFVSKPGDPEFNECPADTAVGVATVTYNLGKNFITTVVETVPLFNVEPAYGEPARFGFYLPTGEFGVDIDTSVETGGDYGVISTVPNIPDTASYLSSEVTFWGTPGSAVHNEQRGWSCTIEAGLTARELQEKQQKYHLAPCAGSAGGHPAPLLDLPTSCAGPLRMSLEADSWQDSGHFTSPVYAPGLPSLDGCNQLQFAPEIEVTPDGQQASKPTGIKVDVHVPQEGQLNGAGRAQSNIKNIQVTLPEGVVLNPSSADGLQACSEGLVGYEGVKEAPNEPGASVMAFTPKLPGSFGSSEQLQPGVNFCPNASKIATATIHTPLLPNPLEGAVYLASPQNFNVFPQENPFETHVAMYIVAEDPTAGVLVKLAGKVELGGAPGVEGLAPGQIRSTFEDTPQLPFEDAELHFFGGERAPLASPSRCGTYTTNATYTPWSGGEAVHGSSSFQITSGPNGTPCPGSSLPFSPTLSSGTVNVNAGSFSELTTTLSREDGQQSLQSVTLHYPAGVSGLLSGVKLCAEAQANAGTCGPESQIGETIVSVGVGGDPFTVTGGKVYITEKYGGAPFGLSIVTPAKAGPFDLQEGHPVVVRAKIEVNPIDAALTVTTNPSGEYAIPTIVEGFALQIQHVNVLINRPGFTFNPTNCTPAAVTGTIDSAEGASSPVSVPFQVANCAVLAFKPGFRVSTAGKTSRKSGASLHVQLTYPKAPFGSQANIKSVKVDLPKQLPSRLPTLQHACPAKTFEANPASCQGPSIVGHAIAITPLIPVPLTGPAYFVSYGGAKFPELVIVLQGYGVTLDLHGETFINEHTDVTSSTFHTVPDAPVGSFELTLPQGEYSALAATANLCKTKLVMPTAFTAQNGMEIHESTPISVTGCSKVKKTKVKKVKKTRSKKTGHGRK
jgi:hypothetical protein